MSPQGDPRAVSFPARASRTAQILFVILFQLLSISWVSLLIVIFFRRFTLLMVDWRLTSYNTT